MSRIRMLRRARVTQYESNSARYITYAFSIGPACRRKRDQTISVRGARVGFERGRERIGRPFVREGNATGQSEPNDYLPVTRDYFPFIRLPPRPRPINMRSHATPDVFATKAAPSPSPSHSPGGNEFFRDGRITRRVPHRSDHRRCLSEKNK